MKTTKTEIALGSLHHMCVEIEGVLAWPDKELRLCFGESAKGRSTKAIRDWMKLQLHEGKRVLPIGKPCEGFDYQNGCPGHPKE